MEQPEPAEIFVLECYHKDMWHTIKTSMDRGFLESLEADFIKGGWTKDTVRITSDTFKFKGIYKDD